MNQLSEHQQLLLKVYKEFVQFCSQHNISFFAAYGTMIGAIRHHGFIPWDDDIDVYMFREDYDKFVSLGSLLPEPYKIITHKEGKNPYPIAKFYTTEGTIWEYRQFPFIIGPWIDVFPIDEGDLGNPESDAVFEKLHYTMWKYRKAIAYDKWGEIGSDFFHFNVIEGAIKLFKKIRYAPFKEKYINQISDCFDTIKGLKGNTFRCYNNAMKNEVFKREWLQELIEMPFEDTVIKVPCGYDELLTSFYGDYKTPPPEEKRKGHTVYYIDLNHTKTRDEILKENKDAFHDRQSLSVKVLWDEIKHRSIGWQRPKREKKE